MLGTDDQEVRILRAGGHRVAYAVVGAGPPVVLGGWWCAHLELNWQDPRFRRFLAPLAARHSIIRFDPPGTGASDGGDTPATVQDEGAEQAARSLAASYRTDVTEHLPRVRVPTRVIHRRGDRAVPFALGADVARRIRGATLVPLDGVDHFPWRGDTAAVTDAMLRGLGHRLPDRPEPAAVTDREREILALVAVGLTDGQIAERLTLSPHTVHRHVANARIKLGVRSRAAAAAALGAAGEDATR